MRHRTHHSIAVSFAIGFFAGSLFFSGVQPRSVLAIHHCEHCLRPSELAGLAGAVIVTKLPNFLPQIVIETDKTVAIVHPTSPNKNHYVIFPKKDIKNIGDLSTEDQEYIVDMFAVINELIRMKSLKSYRVWTNGPENQDVTYLHFHLASYE